MSGDNKNQFLSNLVRKGVDKLVPLLARLFSFVHLSSAKTRDRFREIFHTTSGQVREKAGETTKAVKLRMTMLEIEHHLNRLYPQIGKITCDLSDKGKKMLLNDDDLKGKVKLAKEYRDRLTELRKPQDGRQPEKGEKG